MNGWKHSFNRKKHQRMVNKYVRAINKNIENDDLWLGRFYVKQVGFPRFEIYEDKSGATLEGIHLVCVDRKTGQTYDDWDSSNGWCHWGGSRIWMFVNKAITEWFDVWKEDPSPYEQKKQGLLIDYRRKK